MQIEQHSYDAIKFAAFGRGSERAHDAGQANNFSAFFSKRLLESENSLQSPS
jgi:hypothetical protein